MSALSRFPTSFTLHRSLLSPVEQSALLTHSLVRLAKVRGDVSVREQRRAGGFCERGRYRFDEGHLDGVIKGYREAAFGDIFSAFPSLHPSSFLSSSSSASSSPSSPLPPTDSDPPLPPKDPTHAGSSTDAGSLQQSLQKIFNYLLSHPTLPQTISPRDFGVHILHLSPSGSIDAHVDHVEASGDTIASLSLGSERTIVFSHPSKPQVEIALPPGSIYLQSFVSQLISEEERD